MGTALRELIAQFTVGVDDKALKELDKTIDRVAGKLSAFGQITAAVVVAEKVGRWFDTQIEQAAHVQDLAERLDISATAMKDFGFAASTAGVDFDAAARALGFLEKAQGGALFGMKANVKAFKEIGVAVKDSGGKAKPLEELLGDVADAMAKLPNQAERAAAATKLFGRAGRDLLPLLDQGGAKIRALMADAAKLGSGLGDDYYLRAKKAREETLRVGYAFQSLKDRITSAALPGIMSFLEWVEKIETKFLDWTKRTYALETAVSFFAAAAGAKFLVFLFQAARALGLIKATALETLGAFAGFAVPLALVGALYVAFDDLYTLMEGGKSEIGELLDRFEGPGAADKFRDSMKAAWGEIKTAGIDAAKAIGDIFGADTSGDVGGWVYVKALESIRDVAVGTARELRNVSEALDNLFGKKAPKEEKDLPGWAALPGQIKRLGKFAADLFPSESHDQGRDAASGIGSVDMSGVAAPPSSGAGRGGAAAHFAQKAAEAAGVRGYLASPTVPVGTHFDDAGPVIKFEQNFVTHVTVPPGTTDPHGIAAGVGPALAPHVAAAHRDALQSQTVP